MKPDTEKFSGAGMNWETSFLGDKVYDYPTGTEPFLL